MSEGKLVRISQDTMKKLGDQAKPFETPDKCINRLLTNSCLQNPQSEDENE